MKFLDKIKDLFTDVDEVEVEREIEIEEKPKERKLPTVMREETMKDNQKEDKEIFLSDRDLFRDSPSREELNNANVVNNTNNSDNNGNNNFRFPIAFEEKDFKEDKIYSRQNVIRKEQEKPKPKETYIKPKKEEKISLFKASPVISPVYGILDKNYTKEEVQAKDKSTYEINRGTKKVDFESVRKKAFGSLADDIKDNLSDTKKEKININDDSEDLLYDMTTEPKEITLGNAEENYFDFGVAYENAKKTEEKNDTIEEKVTEVKIMSYEKAEPKAEKIEVAGPIIDKSKQDDEFSINKLDENTPKDNLELSDDIFNLIDNMYQEKGDE